MTCLHSVSLTLLCIVFDWGLYIGSHWRSCTVFDWCSYTAFYSYTVSDWRSYAACIPVLYLTDVPILLVFLYCIWLTFLCCLYSYVVSNWRFYAACIPILNLTGIPMLPVFLYCISLAFTCCLYSYTVSVWCSNILHLADVPTLYLFW